MWDFSDDEWFFFIVAAAIAALGGFRYYRRLTAISPLCCTKPIRTTLAITPVVATIPTLVVLSRWADAQVVGHLDYMLLFLLGATAWIFTASWSISLLGISFRDDAIERNNSAAAVTCCGALLGVGLVYALSNIGGGPTIWTTIWPAFVATVALAISWLLIELIGGGVAEAITIDRDLASAFRLAGAVFGCAIILGRAAAGDWKSWHQTWVDLAVRGWPAFLLACLAGILHRLFRPTAERPKPEILLFGVLPGCLLALAGVIVALVVS